MLVHGDEDHVVPVGDLARLAAARRATRPLAVTETLIVEGGRHSWLSSAPLPRRPSPASSGSRSRTLTPDEAAARAAAVPGGPPSRARRLTAIDEEPGGFRSLARIFQPGRRPEDGRGATATAAATEACSSSHAEHGGPVR